MWEFPGSNLGPETGYRDMFSMVFLKPSRQMPYSIVNYITINSFHIFPIHYS
jgi:hypothetical protein